MMKYPFLQQTKQQFDVFWNARDAREKKLLTSAVIVIFAAVIFFQKTTYLYIRLLIFKKTNKK